MTLRAWIDRLLRRRPQADKVPPPMDEYNPPFPVLTPEELEVQGEKQTEAVRKHRERVESDDEGRSTPIPSRPA